MLGNGDEETVCVPTDIFSSVNSSTDISDSITAMGRGAELFSSVEYSGILNDK